MPHQRSKSGHGFGNTSMADMSKNVSATDPMRSRRPGLSRRLTPSQTSKSGRNTRERKQDGLDSWNDERESFPQYCMTCEKEFVSHDERFLYCSERCRRFDQDNHAQDSSLIIRNASGQGYRHENYSLYRMEEPEPRDIVPRASPSRPNSTYMSNSPPESSMTLQPNHRRSAISSLRSLNTRVPSPPSPNESGTLFWPFNRHGHSPGTRPSGPCLTTTFGSASYEKTQQL